MIEDAVEHDADALLLGQLDQLLELLVGAEELVDLVVILRVVGVVGTGFEDGVQIDDGDAQRLEIIQPLHDAAQVAAEVVAAARGFVAWLRCVLVGAAVAFGQIAPVLDDDLVERFGREAVARLVALGVVVGSTVAEAVREDLVDDGVLHPRDGLEGRVVDGDDVAVVAHAGPRFAPAAVAEVVVVVEGCRRAVLYDEAIVERRRHIRGNGRLPEVAHLVGLAGIIAGDAGGHALHVKEALRVGGRVPDAHAHARHVVGVGAEAQRHRVVGVDGAEGHAIEAVV